MICRLTFLEALLKTIKLINSNSQKLFQTITSISLLLSNALCHRYTLSAVLSLFLSLAYFDCRFLPFNCEEKHFIFHCEYLR